MTVKTFVVFNPAHLVESVPGILQLATRMGFRVGTPFSLKINLRDWDIGGVRLFDVNSDPSSVGTECKRWLRSFQLYGDGKGLIIVPDKDDNTVQRRALLLHCAGPHVQDIFDVLADTWSAKGYQKPKYALTRHFVTQIKTPYERHLFREMVQAEDETIDQFTVRLRHKAQQCDYGDQMNGGSDQ